MAAGLSLGSILLGALSPAHSLKAQSVTPQIISLYDQKVPGSLPAKEYKETATTGKDGVIRISQVSSPTLTIFKPNGGINAHTAVIICPGGAYKILAFNLEGTEIAKRLSGWGITAFVLKYRLPSDQIMADKSVGPLMDAQRAIAVVRSQAAKWDVNPARIGIMGFSAGGHLAASLSTLYTKDVLAGARPVGGNHLPVSLRPDFSILGYPVISMEEDITHKGSRTALLGGHPDPAQIREWSCDLQVTDSTPPAFLVLADDDHGVPPANSLRYVEALQKHKVPVELHMYQNGGHGFGGHNKHSPDDWLERLRHWMQHNKWIPKQ